jgi:hypothetical protein
MRLSALTFQQRFLQFEERVRRRSRGKPFTSFREGLPADQEDYKEDVRNEGLRRLGFDKWKSADVGSGRILKQTINAIEIDGLNNLVRWQNRWGHDNRSHRALLDARSSPSARRNFERWLLEFFRSLEEEANAFESFRRLAGDRYDLLAYLFFLKDWNRFMPIAPVTFDKAFKLQGIELVTRRRCSWDNYALYNAALVEVQDALRNVAGIPDARLIDAHSFC